MFDRTLDVIRRKEGNEWELADALLAEIAPSRLGVANGTRGTWEQLAEALAAEGFEYSLSTLRQYRDTAAHWKPDDRVEGVSFTAHRYAKKANDPRALIVRLKETKGSVTTADVRAAVSTGQKQTHKLAVKSAAKLAAELAEIDKASVKAMSSTPEGRAAIEDLRKQAFRVANLISDYQSSATGQKQAAAAPKPAPAKKPAAAPKATAAKKGRQRGM